MVDNQIVRYTNAEADVVVGSFTYVSETITYQEPSRTFDEDADRIVIEIPNVNPMPQYYTDIVPAGGIIVSISVYHRTDAGSEIINKFEGTIRSCVLGENGRAELTALSDIADFNEPMPHDTFQGQCNNVLGDSQCTVDLSLFKVDLTVLVVSSNVYTISGLSTASGINPDYFLGGVITSPNGDDSRTIIQVNGDDAHVLIPFPTSQVTNATVVTVEPGCDHILESDCANTYNNAINYFGFRFVPDRNIFEVGLI